MSRGRGGARGKFYLTIRQTVENFLFFRWDDQVFQQGTVKCHGGGQQRASHPRNTTAPTLPPNGTAPRASHGKFGFLGETPIHYRLLQQSEDMNYLLLLRQDFIDRMQLSAAYLKMPCKETQPNKQIDRLVAQLPSAKDKYDWSLLPAELRPKLLARKEKPLEVRVASKDINVQEK